MGFKLLNYVTIPQSEDITITYLQEGKHPSMGGLVVNYAITRKTKAIIPCFHAMYQTIIIEEDNRIFLSQYNIFKIIDENCKINGSSYKGRQTSIYRTMKEQRKLPIPVDPIRDVFLVPTHAINNTGCICINPTHYQDFVTSPRQSHQHKNIIVLSEKVHIPTPISKQTMIKQMQKCSDMRLTFLSKRTEHYTDILN